MTDPTTAMNRFLEALRTERHLEAIEVLRATPELSRQGPHAAAALGDASALAERLRADPAAATTPDAAGWPPLLYLCVSRAHTVDAAHAEGSLRCAALLLDHGAGANTHVLFEPGDLESKRSVLYDACMSDNVPVVELLLEGGADPNDGESIYHSAQYDRRACLELLLKHGADLSGRHARWNNTPLFFLAGYREGDPGAAVGMEGMRWLLEHGADPNVTSLAERETPLHRVAIERSLPVIDLLLAHGADPRAARADGRTPYTLAVRSGNAPAVERFTAVGAAVPLSTVDAFIGDCMRGDVDAAHARRAGHPTLMHELDDEDRATLGVAAGKGRTDCVRLMVALGFDPAWESPDAGTPLHKAAWRGHADTVRALLELRAPVDARDSCYGSSALGWAAHGARHFADHGDYAGTVDALIDAGASREAAINRWGATPVDLATPAIAKRLEARGFKRKTTARS